MQSPNPEKGREGEGRGGEGNHQLRGGRGVRRRGHVRRQLYVRDLPQKGRSRALFGLHTRALLVNTGIWCITLADGTTWELEQQARCKQAWGRLITF